MLKKTILPTIDHNLDIEIVFRPDKNFMQIISFDVALEADQMEIIFNEYEVSPKKVSSYKEQLFSSGKWVTTNHTYIIEL